MSSSQAEAPSGGLNGHVTPHGAGHAAEGVPVLAVADLSVHYGSLAAVDGVSFACDRGVVTAIIGPNGSGKTSTLNAITGLVASRGSIKLVGREVAGSSPRQMYRQGLARTFQNLDLIDDRTVLENVALGAAAKTRATLAESMICAPRARRERQERRAGADRAIQVLDLGGVADRRSGELSYGLRRRVEVARALAGSPQVVLLDEPTAGMGPAESADFGEILVTIARDLRISVVVIEHDMSVVRAAAGQVCVLAGGRVIAEGPPLEVLSSEPVQRVYLGDGGGL